MTLLYQVLVAQAVLACKPLEPSGVTTTTTTEANTGICGEATSKTIFTEDGNPCVFPFRHDNQDATECVSYKNQYVWCATSLKDDCTYLTWGICAPKFSEASCCESGSCCPQEYSCCPGGCTGPRDDPFDPTASIYEEFDPLPDNETEIQKHYKNLSTELHPGNPPQNTSEQTKNNTPQPRPKKPCAKPFSNQGYIFRVLRDDESCETGTGIFPGGLTSGLDYTMSPHQHVQCGSSTGATTPFVSFTSSIAIANKWATKKTPAKRIAIVTLDDFHKDCIFYDLTTKVQAEKAPGFNNNAKAVNFAVASCEILVQCPKDVYIAQPIRCQIMPNAEKSTCTN